MSEAVEILIKADDKASAQFANAATNIENSYKRVESIVNALQSPSEKYAAQIAEINSLYIAGAMTADQYAAANEKLQQKLQATGTAADNTANKLKKTSDFFGTLAGLAGVSELQTIASTFTSVTEKVNEFGEVSKASKASAIAFQGGLVILTAVLASKIGTALGNVIFQTAKFERELKRTKEAAGELEEQVKSLQSRMMQDARADIEIIKDPEAKKQAYAELLESLNKNIQGVSQKVKSSEKDVEAWAGKWKITGDQKAFAAQAEEQLKIDKEQLKTLKAERDEIIRITGAREAERQAIAAKYEAQANSAKFLDDLRNEIELLKATKEEQLAIEAARSTTPEDRGEAERLLKERDALIAKKEAEKEAEQERKRIEEEKKKAAEDALQKAEEEKQQIADLIAKEEERLKLREIELTKGKEAAKIQQLVNQGIDEQTAKQLVAKEAELDAQQKLKEKGAMKQASPLQASESRLLTRGSGNPQLDKQIELLSKVDAGLRAIADTNRVQLAEQRRIAENTSRTTNVVVPV